MRRAAWGTAEGAVLVQAALSMIALTAFSALVIDYGVFWVSRVQAQNAVDAAAMAGSVALAFDDFTDRGETGAAKEAAFAVAALHTIWLEPPSVIKATDITFPNDCGHVNISDPGSYGGQSPCIRVAAYRTSARGNALPTYFARLVDVTSQDVQAVATARVVVANATDCLRPLAIPDKWVETTTPTNPWPSVNARFNKYANGSGTLLALRDSYAAPGSVPGTGFRTDFTIGGTGQQLTLTEAPQPWTNIAPGQFVAVDVPRPTLPAGNAVQANMESCNGVRRTVGGPMTPLAGANVAFATAGAATLIAADSAAAWNTTTKKIQNSCATNTPPCAPFSPRLIALPVFDVSEYDRTRWAGQTLNLVMVNVVGFFIESATTTSITGRLAYYPGLVNSSASLVNFPQAFLRTSVLVR